MTYLRHGVAAALAAASFATSLSAAAAEPAAAAAPAPAVQQDGPAGRGPDGGPHPGPGMHEMGMVEEGMHGAGMPGRGMPFGRLHGLNLTEAQQDKLFNIMYAQAPQHREYEKAIRKTRRALRELAGADRFDDAKATALSRDLGQAIAGEALLRARMEAQVLAMLTPEQRTRLRERRGHRHGPGGAGGTGRPDGPPPAR